MRASAFASAAVIVPNCACPSARGGAIEGTTMSCNIQPSYQPDSLLMTNMPEISVKKSLKDSTSFGSVGNPGLCSSVRRTEPMVGSPPLAQLHAVGTTPLLI